MALQTENTGKIFERAICLVYDVPYDGKYKYGLEAPTELVPRLLKLKELFPQCTHSAKSGARYDFTSTDGTQHLSAKTTKKDGKVAPQVIGQARPEKFCEHVGFVFTDIPTLKKDIQENISKVLCVLFKYTFDCPIVYYNQHTGVTKFIKVINEPNWDLGQEYAWTKNYSDWQGSSTLKIGTTALVEFQFHSKNRTNMAIRWCFENFLKVFSDCLEIVLL